MREEDKSKAPDALARAMELELAQKRAAWERERQRHRTIRLLGFSFLSLVVFAAMIALFLLLSHTDEMRSQRPPVTPVPSPQSARG